MNLSNIKPESGSRKNRKRRGRGPGSGLGKTSGRGHKGQLAGSGYSRRKGFEGGQMPLVRRLPKRGFNNIFRQEYAIINLSSIEKISKTEIGPEDFINAGIIKKKNYPVKVLGEGELTSARTVIAHSFSKSAIKKIEAQGGKAVVIGNE